MDLNLLLKELKKVSSRQESIEKQLAALQKPQYAGDATPGKLLGAKGGDGASEDPKWGWKSVSEFCRHVRLASDPMRTGYHTPDPRLKIKAVSGMSESSAGDGGFLIPPEFSQKIFERVYDNDLLSRTDQYTVAGNTMLFPAIDEQSRVDGSRMGGILGYWLDEAGQITSSKAKIRQIRMQLKKLACLAYVTDELLTDASLPLEQYLIRLFAEEIKFQMGAAIFAGPGGGQPLGFLGAPCTVSVAKETGQAAATILTENIIKMWARMWAPSKKNAVWLVNQDITQQLLTMTLGVGTGGVVTYMPPGGLSQAPYATLFGRPVFEVEFARQLGTKGDIALVDLSQYLTISKGSADAEMSMHLRFDFDELAFRVIFRADGQPWWNTALTPYKGSATQSPFIVLDTRA